MNRKKKLSILCYSFVSLELLILLIFYRQTMIFFNVLTIQIILLFFINYAFQYKIVAFIKKKYPNKIKFHYNRYYFGELATSAFNDDKELKEKRIVLTQLTKCFFLSIGILFSLGVLNIVTKWLN